MRLRARSSFGTGLIALVAFAVLVVAGSLVYWLAEGRPGTPDDFRRRVADTGLRVDWSNAGPRGGSGVVDTACGPVEVTITDMDGQLWIRWTDRQEPATREAMDALLVGTR